MIDRAPRPALLALALCWLACGGQETGSAPIDLTTEPMFVDGRCMAWDGEAYAVVWFGRSEVALSDIFFARISAQGEFLFQPQRIYQGLDEVNPSCHLLAASDGYTVLFDEVDGDVELFQFSRVGTNQGDSSEIADTVYGWAATQSEESWALLYSDSIGNGDYEVRLLVEGAVDPVVIAAEGGPRRDMVMRWLPGEKVYAVLSTLGSNVEISGIPAADPVTALTLELFESESGQGGPLGLLQTSTGSLWATWVEDDRSRFLPVDSAGALLWQEPRALIPDNRAAEIDLDLAASLSGAVAVWQGDHDTGLPQIYAAALDLDLTEISDAQPISDGQHSFRQPRVAAGDDGYAVIYEGAVDSTERLFWTVVEQPPAP